MLQRHCSADQKWLAIMILERPSQNWNGNCMSGSMDFFTLRSVPLFAAHALGASHNIKKHY